MIRFAGVDHSECSVGHGIPSKFEKCVSVRFSCWARAFILAMNAVIPGP